MRFGIKITDNFLLEPVLHTFGVKPETSYVELDEQTMEVSMGRWFHERIPVDQIASFGTSEWPWWGGLGVKLTHHGVGVVGSTDGVVNVKFKSPQKVHVLAVIDAEQLFLSLEDRDGFLAALSKVTGLAIGGHVAF